jgi:bifunctional non-homologous end joining protein LigD
MSGRGAEAMVLRVGGSQVRLTSPEKVLYADQGVTKRDLAEYYAAVAPWVLRYARERPMTLVRCPEGRSDECFYQKHPGVSIPASVGRVEIREKSGSAATYLYVSTARALLELVQLEALELHVWAARRDRLERPDTLIFDLDPGPGVAWAAIVEAARVVRDFLEGVDLKCYIKTTGGKGVHVTTPLIRRQGWPELGRFARAVAERLAAGAPSLYTVDVSRSSRPGRIFIDYLRNMRGATSVAPYSSRARAGATVATPITWRELADVRPGDLTIRSVPGRLRSPGADPWEGYGSVRQSISAETWARLVGPGS